MGERTGYEALYGEHYRRVLRLCRMLLADPHEAEEVGKRCFGTVAYPGGISTCRDRRRSRWWKWWRAAAESLDDDALPSERLTPEEEALSGETRSRIWQSFQLHGILMAVNREESHQCVARFLFASLRS